MVYYPKVEMKSRRVRKSRITRRHRGGFFGKLFEGFQTVAKPMEVLDTDVGGSAGAGAGSLVSNVPGILKALSIDPTMERPTQMPTSQMRSSVAVLSQPTIVEEGRAPTAAIRPPPPRIVMNTPDVRMDRVAPIQSQRVVVPYVASPKRIDQQITQLRPASSTQIRTAPTQIREVPMNRPATGTPAFLSQLSQKTGGKRKSLKSRKSRKARKH
jgi:hypothetical protein